MSDFELYFSSINDGRIIACEKMKRISEILLNRYAHPDRFHFDPDIAKKHIDFIETICVIPSGNIGAPLKLELFQRGRLEAVFGFVDDNGFRQYIEALIIEGRKNGKTTESASVECDLLINDGEGSPQIYNIATKMDQAKLGFNAVHKMIMLSPMKRHVRKRASDLYYAANLGYIKPLSSKTNTMDGLDIHGAIIDELAAIKNRDLYDLILQGMGARKQPLLFCISTNGFVRDNIFDSQYEYADDFLHDRLTEPNERFLPFIYELDNYDEWDKEECWIKANPGLGSIKSVDFMRQMVSKAKDDPSFKPTVLVKDFNLKQSPESRWLRYEDAENTASFDLKFDYAIGGFDAADSGDLNAAVALFQRPNDENIYVRSMFWIPESVLEEQEKRGDRIERDRVPYRLWVEQGYMRTCHGNKCDKSIFYNWYEELRDDEGIYTSYIFYDPWHIDDSLLQKFKLMIGKNNMIPVRQGVKSLSQPMKDMKSDLQAKKIIYNNNPVLKSCLIKTNALTDINGNIQPVKSSDPRCRIDGTVALLCAYKGLRDVRDKYVNLNARVK